VDGVLLLDRAAGDVRGGHELGALLGRCVEPALDVAAGDEEGVALGDGEGVPEGDDVGALVEDEVLAGLAEGAGHGGVRGRCPPFVARPSRLEDGECLQGQSAFEA